MSDNLMENQVTSPYAEDGRGVKPLISSVKIFFSGWTI
jgi:hypothetical protein